MQCRTNTCASAWSTVFSRRRVTYTDTWQPVVSQIIWSERERELKQKKKLEDASAEFISLEIYQKKKNWNDLKISKRNQRQAAKSVVRVTEIGYRERYATPNARTHRHASVCAYDILPHGILLLLVRLFGSKDEHSVFTWTPLAECMERPILLMCDLMFSCASVDICCGLNMCVCISFDEWRWTRCSSALHVHKRSRRHKEKTEEKNDFMWNNYAKQSRKRKSEMHLCVVCAVGEKHLLRRLFTQNAFYFFCSFSVKKTNDTMQSHRNGVRVAYDVAWRRWPKYSQPEWPKQNMYEEKANILTEKMKSQLLRHRLSVWNVFSPSLCLRVCLDAEWSI